MQNKLKLTTLFLFGLGLKTLVAQNAILPTGGDGKCNEGSISYSIGQVLYTAYKGSNGTLRHGVQRPYESSIISKVKDVKSNNMQCIVYPNPTSSFIKLKIEGFTGVLYYLLYDSNGRLLDTRNIESDEVSIDLSRLCSATYFLNVIQKKQPSVQEIKSFKIIKN
jgi:hypothetical protein